MAKDLVTLEEYKAYAGISSTNQDSVIEAIIPKVSQLVKTYCRRTFVDYIDDAKTEVFSGGYGQIYLHEYPLIRVNSISYSSDYGQTYTDLVEYTDYAIDLESGTVICLPEGYEFTKGINAYQISYLAGYEEFPEDLKVACLDLVTYYVKNDSAVHSPKAPGTNTVQIEYITSNSLPAHIARVLNLYKGSWD